MVWEARNRVCIVKNVDVKEGAICSIEEKATDGMPEVMPLSFEKHSTCGQGKGTGPADFCGADELSHSRFLGRSQLRSGCKLP